MGVLSPRQLTASTACLAGHSFSDSLQAIRKLGFDGVEILTFTGAKHSVGDIPGVVVAQLTTSEKRSLRGTVERFRFVTTHLPFHGLYPAAQDAVARRTAQERILQAVEDSGFWGASVATAHAAVEPGQTLDSAKGELVAFFRRVGDAAARQNVRIGIETGWPNTVESYLALLREIAHEHVGATVDTGHIRSYRSDIGVTDEERPSPNGIQRYNDVLLQIVNGLGPKLFHFHFDDVRPADWRDHRQLGTGIVNWNRLLTRLSAISYSGTFALELEEMQPVPALVQSRNYYISEIEKVLGQRA